MEWWKLLFEIPAAVTASVMIVNLLPFSLDPKLNPWLMFFAALMVLFLPWPVVVALAIAVPMGVIYGWTGVRLQGHAPVKLPIEQAKALTKMLKVPKKTEVREFLTKEYPDPSVEKYVPELLEASEVVDITEQASLTPEHCSSLSGGVIDARNVSHVGEFTCESSGLSGDALTDRKSGFVSPSLEAARCTFVVTYVSTQCDVDVLPLGDIPDLPGH
jgi:hypothetical protein